MHAKPRYLPRPDVEVFPDQMELQYVSRVLGDIYHLRLQ